MVLAQWQDGLSKTRIDTNTARHIVELEMSATEQYDKKGGDFVDSLIEVYDKNRVISPDELQQAFLSVFDDVVIDLSTPYAIYFKSIVDSGRSNALKDLGFSREGRRKIRAAIGPEDPFVQDSLTKSFKQVRTVGDDAIKEIMKKWTELGGPTDVVRTMLMEEDVTARGEPLSREQLKNKLYEIWQDKRYLLERIVRTETINTYARAQLQEWHEQGIKEVERHEVNDLKTCDICRKLMRADHEWHVCDVEKLLVGGYSTTSKSGRTITSAEYPISWCSHPNCRGSYSPRVNWSVFEEFEREFLDLSRKEEFVNASDIVVQDSVAENVPIEYKEQVQQALEDFGPDYKIRFVPEITESEIWKRERLEDLRSYYPEPEATSRLMLEQADNRGKITQYTAHDGTVLVSGSVGDVNMVVIPILREHARKAWMAATDEQKDWVIQRFNDKIREMDFTLEEHGVQIIGETPFVSPLAKEGPESYFIESYAAYVADPTRLVYFDSQMYDFLRGNFMDHEYLARGGVN